MQILIHKSVRFSPVVGVGTERHSLVVDSSAFHNPLKKKDSFLQAMQSATEGAKDESNTTTGALQNFKFRPVTLTVQAFYKQVSYVCVCP